MGNEKITIRFPRLFQHQEDLVRNLAPRNFLCWGAGAGKSRLSLYLQAGFALDCPGTDSAWIDRDGKFARDAFRKAGALLPAELVADRSKIDLYYRLVNGAEWWFYSGLEPDAFRGRQRHSVVLNEAAYIKEEGWFEVLAPRLKGWALFNTTPKGRRNFTFRVWSEAGNNPGLWYRSHHPTTANPGIEPEQIERARLTMPDAVFRQEILAEFVSDFGRFFNPSERCWVGQFESFVPGARYAAGLDWAEVKDYTAWAILRTDTLPRRLVSFGRLSHIKYTEQIPILVPKLKAYGNPPCLADASESTANQLMRAAGCRVEDFAFSSVSKPYLADGLRVVLEQAQMVMPPGETKARELKIPTAYAVDEQIAANWLHDEIEFFEPHVKGGRVYLGARGEHNDDILAALMLANEAANRAMLGTTGGIVYVSAGGRGRRF